MRAQVKDNVMQKRTLVGPGPEVSTFDYGFRDLAKGFGVSLALDRRAPSKEIGNE